MDLAWMFSFGWLRVLQYTNDAWLVCIFRVLLATNWLDAR